MPSNNHTPHTRDGESTTQSGRYLAIGILALVALAVLLTVLLQLQSCATSLGKLMAPPSYSEGSREQDDNTIVLDSGRTTPTGEGRLSFVAVGDNLANENILELADSWEGEAGDGLYNFSPLYSHIAENIQTYDVAFVNQETTLGGGPERGMIYAGYPSYNTPDSMADALASTGFRVVNTNSNHTYDTWIDSIVHAQEVWNAHDSLITIGSYSGASDRSLVRMVEANGVRIAFLSYSYGQNGYRQSDLPNSYYAVPMDLEALETDVERARLYADAVVVYMHAGDEYSFEPNDQQREFAQRCADSGVDLVIGSHAHVIQPVEWLTRSDASAGSDSNSDLDGSQMLVVYGLGDFVSGYHKRPECVLSGMFSCTFVKGDEGVVVENPSWEALIEHWEGEQDYVVCVADYSSALAKRNELLEELDDPYAWLQETTESVIDAEYL